MWTFQLPGLRERPEDVEPNLDHELREASAGGALVTMSRQARERFVAFATSPDAIWAGNFRDFSAAVTRMAALAPGGRITEEVVAEEIERLRHGWRAAGGGDPSQALVERALAPEAHLQLDAFDRVQLAEVLRVCAGSTSLSDAGRRLFSVSRGREGGAERCRSAAEVSRAVRAGVENRQEPAYQPVRGFMICRASAAALLHGTLPSTRR